MSAGQDKTFRVEGWNIGGSADTWDISTLETGDAATTANFNIVAGSSSLALPSSGRGSFAVTLEATQTAGPGKLRGLSGPREPGDRHAVAHPRLAARAAAGGQGRPADRRRRLAGRRPGGLPQHVHVAARLAWADLRRLRVRGPFPTVENLHRYRSIVVFTGDHASFATSGFTVANHDALAEYLDSGGRLWAVGQNWALTADSGTFHSRLDRGRITSGYLGLAFESNSVYGTNPAPQPTANGLGPFAAMTLSLNQSSIDAYSPIQDTDTYASQHTTTPFFRQIGGTAPAGSAISFGRSSEPSLEEERQGTCTAASRWASASRGRRRSDADAARRSCDGLAARQGDRRPRVVDGRARSARP